MPRPVAPPAVLALLLLALASPSACHADDSLGEARALVAKQDPCAAVERIERALPDAAGDDLAAMLELLRATYPEAAKKAEADGRPRDARHYRDALQLLASPDAKDAKPDAPEPEPVPKAVEDPAAESPAPEPESVDHRRLGDEAWKAKRYAEAGEHYAALAKAQKLPPARRDHWAYCRLVVVLERINAGPKTPAEWSEIHAEIDHIRLLSPKNWYGEYLRNVVVERSGPPRKGGNDALIVRGSAPEEPPAKPRAARPKKAPATTKPVALPTPVEADPPAELSTEPPALMPEAVVGQPGPNQGNWRTFVTPNFRIFHTDEALARKAAAKAEGVRREAAKRWTGIEPAMTWTPRCDLYLYPTAAVFAAQTEQPPESPGFSTAGLEGGRVTTRMVRLRADYPKMLDAALPHEVTHIVLADLFPAKQVPRWADEGMAVLSEPAIEQALRLRDLEVPVRQDVLFRLDVLMSADYPDAGHWPLFYAQSVSLTKYLVGAGTPPQFVRFVRMAQQQGPDAALRTIYRIDGVAQLEARWRAHAREAAGPMTAASEGDAGVRRR